MELQIEDGLAVTLLEEHLLLSLQVEEPPRRVEAEMVGVGRTSEVRESYSWTSNLPASAQELPTRMEGETRDTCRMLLQLSQRLTACEIPE